MNIKNESDIFLIIENYNINGRDLFLFARLC
nr:MAG TPA: hypothetical protein [Bacteriophage sp.]